MTSPAVDVLIQLRLMARYGGCRIMPSGVYHQELATTVRDRRYDAPRIFDMGLEGEWEHGIAIARGNGPAGQKAAA